MKMSKEANYGNWVPAAMMKKLWIASSAFESFSCLHLCFAIIELLFYTHVFLCYNTTNSVLT